MGCLASMGGICCNTSLHSSTKKTPFEFVYGLEPPTLLGYVHSTLRMESVDKFLLERDVVIRDVTANLKIA